MFDASTTSLDLAHLAAAPPGPELLAELAELDPQQLPAASRVDYLIVIDRSRRWLESLHQVALVAVAGQTSPADAWGEHEVSAALNISVELARTKVDTARALVGRLPATHRKLADGDISYWHAIAVVDATAGLSTTDAQAVEARVLPRAPDQTVTLFRRSLRRAVLAIDPAAFERRNEVARAERTVQRWPGDDGMAELRLVGPAADIAVIWSAATAAADRAEPGDCRSIGARRFDGIVAWARAALADPQLPKRHGIRAAINVSVSASTLLHLAEAPGELAGFGPIPAAVARELAADGEWTRWVVEDGSGRLLDVGTATYRPGAELRRFILGRSRTCRFPTCSQPAERCELDHVRAYGSGGATADENLEPLCKRHHRLKHETGWTLQRKPDGSCVWTSPMGHTYVRPPDEHPWAA